MTRRTLVAAAIVVALVGAPASAVTEQRPAVIALTQAKITGYATPVVVVERGEEITFNNFDLEKHDVVQDVETDGFGSKKRLPWCEKKKKKSDDHGHHHHDGCPLFWSKLIGLGQSTKILGLKNLKRGETYSFFCTLHQGMKGKLVVR